MIRADIYLMDSTTLVYSTAHKRKEELRNDGWRVKIRKNTDGIFQVWKKHVVVMDTQRGHGNGRRV